MFSTKLVYKNLAKYRDTGMQGYKDARMHGDRDTGSKFQVAGCRWQVAGYWICINLQLATWNLQLVTCNS